MIVCSSEYEQLSVDVLDACFQMNSDSAQLLLLREIPEFNNSCPMEVAVLAEDKVFVSSPCCQHLLVKIWYGEISKDTPHLNIFCSALLPFLSPKLISWESNKNSRQNVHGDYCKLKPEKLNSKKLLEFFKAPYIKFIYDQVISNFL